MEKNKKERVEGRNEREEMRGRRWGGKGRKMASHEETKETATNEGEYWPREKRLGRQG